MNKIVFIAMASLFIFGCSDINTTTSSPNYQDNIDTQEKKDPNCPPIDVIYIDTETNDPSGGGVKDFTIVKTSTEYHIFHITDPLLGWAGEGEKEFGHATSEDLINWTIRDSINIFREHAWSEQAVWAPYIIKEGTMYYMFYTGVEWDEGNEPQHQNTQSIGLATSSNLYDWTLHGEGETGFLLAGPPSDLYNWSAWNTGAEYQFTCRDPFVYYDDNTNVYVMFVSIRLKTNRMAIAVATSVELDGVWTWDDYIRETAGFEWQRAESANLVKYSNTYYLMWSRGEVVKIARTVDIYAFDSYELDTAAGFGLYGYANETLIEAQRSIYGAIVGNFELQFRKISFTTGGNPAATTTTFTSCDFGYDPFDK